MQRSEHRRSAARPLARLLRRTALVVACGVRWSPLPEAWSLPGAAARGRGWKLHLRASPSAEPPAAVEERHCRLPRHRSNARVNSILERAEALMDTISPHGEASGLTPRPQRGQLRTSGNVIGMEDRVYANHYVNLDSVEVVGFDYDYTLVSYKPALLDMLYDKAREVLVSKLAYPEELMEDLGGFDPSFAIRGLAVDLETAWVCKLTYRHKVAAAFNGRERVETAVLQDMYKSSKGAGVLSPEERKKRMRPLNDLFSLVEACLLADVVQWFRDRRIPFEPKSVATDVLSAVGQTHISGSMHRAVVDDLDRFLEPDSTRHMRQLLQQLRLAGKKLMLVSNSEFWYVDAGMTHVVGEDWRKLFDVVVVSAGKPAFYTQRRPFREISARTGRVKWKPVNCLEPGEVYFGGSIEELMRLTNWTRPGGTGPSDGSRIVYFGDSLFADLVEARRLYGWTTGAIIREIRDEMHVQHGGEWQTTQQTLRVLLHTAQLCQEEMGPGGATAVAENRQQPHTIEDREVLDALEGLVTEWRQRQDACMNENFGSVFRASPCQGVRSSPSLFAGFLQRHVDLYTSRVENLRLYSTDHRFYPTEERVGIPHEAVYKRWSNVLDLEHRLRAAEPSGAGGAEAEAG